MAEVIRWERLAAWHVIWQTHTITLTNDKPLGTFEICPVCFWEDDYVQVIQPTWTGANHVTLSEAKENFARFGAVEEGLKPFVRAPYPDEYPL